MDWIARRVTRLSCAARPGREVSEEAWRRSATPNLRSAEADTAEKVEKAEGDDKPDDGSEVSRRAVVAGGKIPSRAKENDHEEQDY